MALYPYQKRVKELLLSGKSVILQAPTGAGKTRAALSPYIEAFFDLPSDQFPRKCIYSVPMRVLANQFFAEYTELTASYYRRTRQQMGTGIQTGERPEDRKLESDLIFTTVDQTLSNFLNIPYAVGTRSANLNAGAVVASYLVFDELHLYDPDIMLPSVLEMLRLLRETTPFVIMTATFSSQMLERLASLLGATVVPSDQEAREQMTTIGSQVGKTRRLWPIDAPLTAQAVLKYHPQARRTICICNTVLAAQNLYQSITAALTARGDQTTQVKLIHAQFYNRDRATKEGWIREQFGIAQADYNGPPLILVATQVIEVGVDATCDVLHTELSPAASLLQRTGRCARRAHETGDVYVYLPRDEQGEPDFTPYFLRSQPRRTERGRRLCEATWQALQATQFYGQHMSFDQEQALIDQVHTPVDREILDNLADRRQLHLEKMLQALKNQEQGLATELIRDINTRFVFIHPNPNQDDRLRRNPWHYDGFALYPGKLAKAFNTLAKVVDSDTPWLMQSAEPLQEKVGSKEWEETPEHQPTQYRWINIDKGSDVFHAAVLAVHPTIARYDTEIGLTFEFSPNAMAELVKRPGKSGEGEYSYRRETYAEHVTGLYRAYRYASVDQQTKTMRQALADDVAFTLRRMEGSTKYGLTPGMVDQIMCALFACHDLGKLSVTWQRWAHEWQRRVGQFFGEDRTIPDDYMAGHTDFEPTEDQKKAQRKLGKRPPHAGESAIAAADLLEQLCGDSEALWRAAMTAIARHHHAKTDSYQPFTSHRAAKTAVQQALQAVGLPQELTAAINFQLDASLSLSEFLIRFDPEGKREILLYLVLVRVLRMADQRSQEK